MWGDISLWFWFTFLWWLSNILCTCWSLVYFLWKTCPFSSLAHFLIELFFIFISLLLSRVSSSYILVIKFLSSMWFAIVGCHFTLLLIFLCWCFLVWCFPLDFYFCCLSFGVIAKNLLLRPMLRVSSVCFLLGVLWYEVLNRV